jgi:ferredoxin
MTHVVTEACIKCKYTDCVEICPVSCFYEGEVMLVINPEQCIDCGLCVPECPIGAIIPDTAEGGERWVDFNRQYASQWPNISEPKFPLPDAKKWEQVPDKLKNHFSSSNQE